MKPTNYYHYYNHFMAPWTVSGTTYLSHYQKSKTRKGKLLPLPLILLLQLFYDPVDFVRDYPGELVPER